MIISVASGKGGTGKTTVAASLASVIPGSLYIDCDVEEPNGHLLLNPRIDSEEFAYKLLPKIDYDFCRFCGKCVNVCEFNALVNLKFEIALFEEMCHSCGACAYFCPNNAISEVPKVIGTIRTGKVSEQTDFADAVLNIGEITAVPLIKKVKEKIQPNKINIIDSPPGTSCSMMETVAESDYCLLVTESTPFGLNDLKLALDVLRTINIPFGVIINKYDETFNELEKYLNDEQVTILLKIPFDKQIAEDYSNGKVAAHFSKKLKTEFLSVIRKINELITVQTLTNN